MSKERGEASNFTQGDEETLLMACDTKEESRSNWWYIDSGCSNHMCGSKYDFHHLDDSFHTTVKFGDDSVISVMGKGDIQIKAKDNSLQTISNVYYAPALKTNLLSIGQLQEKGYVITIKEGTCEISDPRRGTIAQVKMTKNRLFPLSIQKDVQACLTAKVENMAWLWHF